MLRQSCTSPNVYPRIPLPTSGRISEEALVAIEFETSAGDRLLPDCLGHASPPPVGVGAGGRDLHRRSQGAARARGDDPNKLLPAVHRVASLGEIRVPLQPLPLPQSRHGIYRLLELAVGHDPMRFQDLIASRRPRKVPPGRPSSVASHEPRAPRGTGHGDRPNARWQMQFTPVKWIPPNCSLSCKTA